MEVVSVLLLGVVVGVVLFALRESRESRRYLQEQLDLQRRELGQSLTQAQQRVDSLDRRLTSSLDSVRDSVTQSLTGTQQTIKGIGEQLGGLAESSRRILEVGEDVSSLHDILRPPKLRGGFGELLLENLLAQTLPKGHYSTQYHFADGRVVDAVIRVGQALVPVDSKFPLESFSRLLEAGDEEERTVRRREFRRDVRGHVDAVAKYILPDEGTFPFALMYIAAENVYYELIVKDDPGLGGLDLVPYAMERRVIPVSPNSFYAYLQVIVLGLRGLKVEERARDIMAHLARLSGDFRKFQDDLQVLGTHLGNASKKYDELEKRAGRFGDRLSLPLGEEGGSLAEGEKALLETRGEQPRQGVMPGVEIDSGGAA